MHSTDHYAVLRTMPYAQSYFRTCDPLIHRRFKRQNLAQIPDNFDDSA